MASLLSSLIHKFASLSIEEQIGSLPVMVAGVFSNEAHLQLDATMLIRKLLSKEKNPPFVKVAQSGVVPRLVEFLTRYDSPQLQFEAAWALTNIASGPSDSTRAVIFHGAIPAFIKLLGSPILSDIHEQAAWALGNIAGDSPESRDLVLSYGAMNPLVSLLNKTTNQSMLRIGTWALSNFCRGKPQPIFEKVKPALDALGRLVYSDDEEVLLDACWAVSYLADGTNDKIQAVIDSGVCNRLVELLGHASAKVFVPALRAVGNIVAGDDLQTQTIINHGVLPYLLNLLTHHHKSSVKKEVCWIISNITAGTKDQIQAVIDAGLIGPLVSLLRTAEFDVQKESAWAITNAMSGGNNNQIMYLVRMNCITTLCDLLICLDAKFVQECLDGLENILGVGEAKKSNTGGVNYFARLIVDAGGSKKIEELLTHDNKEISEKAAKLLETYWPWLPKQVQPTRRQICARL